MEIQNPVNIRTTLDGIERLATVPEESVRGWIARGWEVVDPEVAVQVARENLEAAQRQLRLARGEPPEDAPAEPEDAPAEPAKSTAKATKATSGGRK
jgi:hypothetical protein